MALLVKRISLSLKFSLAFLFGVLLLGEYMDGVNDVSDWAVLFFFILMANDAFIHLKFASGEPLKGWSLSSRAGSSKKERYAKLLMNIFFTLVLGVSLLMEVTSIDLAIRETVYKIGIILWSGSFLAINVYNLKSSFKISRLIVTNVALMLLIGSVAII